uniref:Uncharacterized protein n=1 Tax=Globodera pallida TaxID=36090 RepID=A0A183BSB1_GLOPA
MQFTATISFCSLNSPSNLLLRGSSATAAQKMKGIGPAGNASSNSATNIQRQRPIQIEEIVVQTVAESIRALGKSPKIRFGFVASDTLPFALDIDVNGILKLINKRKKNVSYNAENVIYSLRMRKNERVNEILFEIVEESSELRGQMLQDLLQVNMQNKWRELNFLFTFARLYRKLRIVLEWTNVGESNWQLKIHEDLLVCLNTLSKEIWKEIVVTCTDIKYNMALKWLENLYQLEVKKCKMAMEHSKMPVKAMTMLGVMRQIRDELAKSDFDKITMLKLSEERANGLEIVEKSLALLNAKIESFIIRQRKELWDVHEFCKKLMESGTNTLNP